MAEIGSGKLQDGRIIVKGNVVRTLWSSEKAHGYSFVPIEEDMRFVKTNAYGSITIKSFQTVMEKNVRYTVILREAETNNYGTSYMIEDAYVPLPATEEDVLEFLCESTSKDRAETLFKSYPNILDLILQGEENKIDVSNIKGIGQKTLDKIILKVKSRQGVMPLYLKYGKYGLSMNILNKLLKRYETLLRIEQVLEENPYKALTEIKGLGFKKADEICLALNITFSNSAERLEGAITYLLEQNELDGNTFMYLDDLYSMCVNLVPEATNSINFEKVINSENFFRGESRIALRKTKNQENFVAGRLIETNVNIKQNDKWHYNIRNYATIDGITLTDTQQQLLKKVCENGVVALVGFAGSGKSQTIASLIKMLKSNGHSFELLTPTAKSADVLAQYTKEDAQTIHRLLAPLMFSEEAEIDADVIIIDEFSMCDLPLFSRLLQYTNINTRIVLVGDSGQLPSISCGNLLYDIVQSETIPCVFLNEIFRYGDGGLLKVVTDIRNMKPFLKDETITIHTFGENKDLCFLEAENAEDGVNKVVEVYQKLLHNGKQVEEINIVLPKRVGDTGSVAVNNRIQQLLISENIISDKEEETVSVSKELSFHVGDKVKQKKNQYKAWKVNDDCSFIYASSTDEDYYDENEIVSGNGRVFNGQTGIIIKIENKYNKSDEIVGKYIFVRISDGVYCYESRDLYENLELGYALSVHSAQGMGIPYVICLLLKKDTFMLNNNLIYTALTRTKQRCYTIGNVTTINKAIKRKINQQRNTFMQELLKQCSEIMDKNKEG